VAVELVPDDRDGDGDPDADGGRPEEHDEQDE
jgi:hypothetical protein